MPHGSGAGAGVPADRTWLPPLTRSSYLADPGQLILEVFDSIVFGIQHILRRKNTGLLKAASGPGCKTAVVVLLTRVGP